MPFATHGTLASAECHFLPCRIYHVVWVLWRVWKVRRGASGAIRRSGRPSVRVAANGPEAVRAGSGLRCFQVAEPALPSHRRPLSAGQMPTNSQTPRRAFRATIASAGCRTDRRPHARPFLAVVADLDACAALSEMRHPDVRLAPAGASRTAALRPVVRATISAPANRSARRRGHGRKLHLRAQAVELHDVGHILAVQPSARS